MVGQRKADRLWPRPRTTRHVWVSQPGVQVPPVQGFVVEWRRHGYRWWALVLTVHTPAAEPPLTKLEWVRAERLKPVRSDPNGDAWRIWR